MSNESRGIFNIIDPALDLFRLVMYGQYLLYGTVFIIFLILGVFSDKSAYERSIVENDVDTSQIFYNISTNKCNVIIDRDGEFVQYGNAQNVCDLSQPEMKQAVDTFSKMSRGIERYRSKNIFVYCVFFWWLAFIMFNRYNKYLIYHSSYVLRRFIVVWLFYSVALFPITFMEYSPVERVYINGDLSYVSSTYLSNDRVYGFTTSPTYMGRITGGALTPERLNAVEY